MTEQTTIEIDGQEVQVTLTDDGVATAEVCRPATGTYTIEWGRGGTMEIFVGENNVAVPFGSVPSPIDSTYGHRKMQIPHDDGTIPRVIGYKTIPSGLLDELRDIGFELADEYGWSEDDTAPEGGDD